MMYRFLEEKNIASGTANDAMRIDFQVKLELLRIINGDGELHCK